MSPINVPEIEWVIKTKSGHTIRVTDPKLAEVYKAKAKYPDHRSNVKSVVQVK